MLIYEFSFRLFNGWKCLVLFWSFRSWRLEVYVIWNKQIKENHRKDKNVCSGMVVISYWKWIMKRFLCFSLCVYALLGRVDSVECVSCVFPDTWVLCPSNPLLQLFSLRLLLVFLCFTWHFPFFALILSFSLSLSFTHSLFLSTPLALLQETKLHSITAISEATKSTVSAN